MVVPKISNEETGVRYAHKILWLALLAHKGMRPYGLPEKTNNLCGMPSPGADDMCSNFAPYAFKGFRFAPISLRETASPPLSAVASSLML